MPAAIETSPREGVELRTATDVVCFLAISAAMVLTGYGMVTGHLWPAFLLCVCLVSIPEPK